MIQGFFQHAAQRKSVPTHLPASSLPGGGGHPLPPAVLQRMESVFGTGFSDAQCGFKAITREAARSLLPLVSDSAWFFDTELLVLAERSGLRIHEVPVDWVDDPDSRVDVLRTALADLHGIGRLASALVRGQVPLDDVTRALGRTSLRAASGATGAQVALFAVIGACSTAAYVA